MVPLIQSWGYQKLADSTWSVVVLHQIIFEFASLSMSHECVGDAKSIIVYRFYLSKFSKFYCFISVLPIANLEPTLKILVNVVMSVPEQRMKNVGDLGISMAGVPLDSRVKLQIVEIISRHLMDTVTTLENVSEEGRNLNHSHSKDHQIHFGNFGLTSLGFRIPKAWKPKPNWQLVFNTVFKNWFNCAKLIISLLKTISSSYP